MDPIEAAAQKAKNKQKKMREERIKAGLDVNSDVDSDELLYDSEDGGAYDDESGSDYPEETEEEKKAAEEFPGYDNEKDLKKKYKIMDGVKFVEYDENLMSKDPNVQAFISKDNSIPDIFIQAPPDLYEAAMRPRGVRIDMDKEVEELNDEGKFLF